MIAMGILGWSRFERQSKRYGFIAVESTGFSHSTNLHYFNNNLLEQLKGKRVRITAVVMEARDSEHVGDMYLYQENEENHLKPSTPNVLESYVLGVGTLLVGSDEQFQNPIIGVTPEDNREHFWMDPITLYRLHEQTVEIFIEEDNESAPLPLTTIKWNTNNTAKYVGDNAMQVNTVLNTDSFTISPKVEKIGDGLFRVSKPGGKLGEEFKIKR